MGLKFRDSSYQRKTWLSKRTVKDGEAMVKWSLGGKALEVVGPARVACKFSTIQFLDRVTAGPFEYLRVERRSGVVEHLRGPRALWVNPVLHSRVEVKAATHLASPSEAIVVYVAKIGEVAAAEAVKSGEAAAKRLERVVVRGPTVFCPAFGQRVAKFVWSDPASPGGKREFESVRLGGATLVTLTAPLTSNDGATTNVTVSLSVSIEDVEKLLDGCEDLPRELGASLASDLVALGRKIDAASLRNLRGLAEHLEGATEGGSAEARVAALPLLARRCAEVGVDLRSVELRASQPSAELAARWRASDDDARALEEAARTSRRHAHRLGEQEAETARTAQAAEADHAARLEAAKRQRELDELDAATRAEADQRAHGAKLQAATRRLQVMKLEAEAELDGLNSRLHRAGIEAAHGTKLDTLRHDEQVRFLTNLKVAGVETASILRHPTTPPPADSSSCKAKNSTALQTTLDGLLQLRLDSLSA